MLLGLGPGHGAGVSGSLVNSAGDEGSGNDTSSADEDIATGQNGFAARANGEAMERLWKAEALESRGALDLLGCCLWFWQPIIFLRAHNMRW